MALVTQMLTSFARNDLAQINMTYDDVALLIVTVQGQNNAGRGNLTFTMTSPQSFTQVLHPGESFTDNRIGPMQIPVVINVDRNGNNRFWGIFWSADFGL